MLAQRGLLGYTECSRKDKRESAMTRIVPQVVPPFRWRGPLPRAGTVKDGQLEVMDGSNRPVAVMPLNAVSRQRLLHRSVAVLLFSPENKLYLQRRRSRKAALPGRWDFSASTPVFFGESTLDAALRALEQQLGVQTDHLRLVNSLPPMDDADPCFLSVFTLGRTRLVPEPNPRELEGGFFYNAEELACLVREFQELLAPGLVSLWRQGMPFPTLDCGKR